MMSNAAQIFLEDFRIFVLIVFIPVFVSGRFSFCLIWLPVLVVQFALSVFYCFWKC